ncbi:MAG: cytochrome c peroxidase [Candidatus Sericytochromatia bacterium]
MKKLVLSLVVFSLLYACKNNDNVTIQNDFNLDTEVQSNKPKASHKTPTQLKKEADDLREQYSKPQSQWPSPTIDYANGGTFKEIGAITSTVKFPSDNNFSTKKAELGKALFFDPRLSGSKKISCSTCHNPQKNWTDGEQQAIGHNGMILKRNSPTIINSGFLPELFWDGRAKSLEAQATAVMLNPNEFSSTEASIKETINSIPAYKTKFKENFGTDNPDITHVAKAIATFERTVNTKNQSNFDKFVLGQKNALSDSAIRGLHIFRTIGKCINCHNGANFTDNKFHNLSLTYEQTDKEDLGLYYITKNEEDWGKFKTPSLRNVQNNGPYMHNGVFVKLKKVLELYSDGMHGKDPHKSPIIKPIGFEDQEFIDLEEFLNSLSETVN